MSALGVALAKETCPACGKDHDGPILLNTVLTEANARKVEALHGKSIGLHICKDCQKVIDDGGIFLVEIDPEKSTPEPNGLVKHANAYRTGRVWGVRREAVERRIRGVGIAPLMFIDPQAVGLLGLDRP
jgi:hypothetical protein